MRQTAGRYKFGPFQLDPAEHRLLREGVEVGLQLKAFEILCLLVENAGRLIKKEEILSRVWPDTIVEENNLNKNVSLLRKALGESATGQSYIETVPRVGYRFVATVTTDDAPAPDTVASLSHNVSSTNGGPSLAANIESSVPREVTAPPVATKAARSLAIAALVLLFAAAYWYGWRNYSARRAPAERAMLAVLPFENLSGNPNEDYLSDGLTQEMIAQLGQVQPASLGVIAGTSTIGYKKTKEPAAQIGRELGAGYLLEGSVLRSGGRVRVTATLVQADQQTHLWAESYERPLTDVLTIQREIAEKIAHSLFIRLLPAYKTSAANAHLDPESYDKYLLGLHELGQGTRESLYKAIQYFQDGIARDPGSSRLYAAMAEAYVSLPPYYSSPGDAMPKAKQAALKAVELDPKYADPHVVLGQVHLYYELDWPAAEAEFRRALEINPSLPDAQLGYADYLATLGRFDEAIARIQQAYLVDPLAVGSRSEALWAYYFSGRAEETAEQARKIIEIAPQSGLAYAMLALAEAQMGKNEEAQQAAENAVRMSESLSVRATAISAMARAGQQKRAKQALHDVIEAAKSRYVCHVLLAGALTDLGEPDKALDSLETAYRERST